MPLPKGWSLAEKSTPVAQPTGLPSGWSLAETGSDVGGPKDFNVNVSHQENLKPRARFKVTVPGLADFDPDGAFSSQEREMRNILMGEDKKKFTSAKIGDELTLSGGKAIKVSEDEIEVPDMEALQNPMESVAIGAGINSPAALAGLAAFGGVSSRVKGTPGMILGAGAGAITAAGTGFGQRKISPDALNELEAETQRRSPVGYNLGRILGSGMKPGGYSGSIGRESAERLLPAGIGAGLQAGVDAYQGKLGTPESNKEILMAAAENLILKDANKLGNKAMGSLAAKPKFKLEIPEPATDITDNLGNAKAGQPLSKTQQDANTMALGKEDLTVLEPAGPLDFGPMPNERGALANEIAANPQAAIDARMVRNAPSAESTVLADLEVRAAAEENAKQIADANQIAINDARGVRQPEPQNAERSVLVERAAEGVDQIAIPEVQVARQKEFNDRVVRVTENLKAEGVELDRQTAAKLALIKDPQEFNAARQQLIDSVKPPQHEIPKAGPVKSLSDLPEIAGPRDLVGPRVPDVLTPSRKKQVSAMPEVAKPVESKGIAIPEAPAKPAPTPEPVVEKPALDAKEAIIQDPNLDADTKIEILQKMATAKPKQDKQTLAQKLLARKKEVEAAKATVTPRTAKNKQAGFSSGAVMANMAAPAVGAAIGSNIGDTPEERIRNAMIGAGIASGSTASLTALANMIKKNPNILKEFKDGFSSAKEANAKQPSLTEQVNAPEPATPSTPDGIGADAVLGNMGKSPVWNGGVLKKFPLLADLAEKFTTHIDSLYEVSPKLAGAMRNWMYESSKLLSEATTRSVSPLTRLRELVGKEDFEGRIWSLLREGREADVLASLDKSGPEGKSIADGLREGWIKDRPEMLEMLRQANPGKVVYVDGQPTYPNQNIGELDNYWPTFWEDLDGLRKAMGTKYKSDIDVAIAKRQESKREEYLKEAAARGEDTSKIGMPSLSDTEIGDIITGVLTKPSTQGNTPGMGNTKKRKLKDIPPEYRKFAAPPDLALAKYYQRAFDSALSKKYTGKANPDGTLEFYGKENAGIFGDILIDGMNDKSIDPRGAQRAVENINSFGKNPDSWKISRVLAPKIGYLQVAGNLAQASSAITQLADVIQTIANTSAKDTFGGFFIDPIIKGKRFKRLEDIGVQEGITEFYEHSKTSGTASWVMDNVFLPLFKPTDKFMKQGIANSNLRFLESGLKAQESGKPTGYRFDIASDRYKSMQGIEEWNKLADAVKRGEWDSDVVNKFAFNRLSDVQPITKAEQAIGKSQLGAGGKIAFGLTGFMLRQMNTLRSNAVGAWRKGDKWDAAKYVAGFLTAQAVAGYTIGTIKGWINGDDDAGVNNIGNVILATFGLNRFMFNQAYDKDFSSIVGERILPGVFSPAKDIISDIGLARDMVTGEKSGSFLEQSEFAKRAPLVGDIYYKNAGAGKEKREKRERSGAESPNDLEKLYDLIEGVDNRKRGSR